MANTRKAEQQAYLKQLRDERNAKELAAKKSTRRFEIAMVSIVLVLIIGFIGGALAYNAYLDSGAKSRSLTVAQTDNFKVDGAMMSYYIYSDFWQLVNYYGSYASYIGLDTSKSLRSQEQAEGTSWFNYFANQALTSVNEMLVLNEAAKASGIELTDEDKAVAEYRAGFTDQTYLPNFGRGVNLADVTNIMKLKLAATRFAYAEMDKADTSDAVIDAKYSESPQSYQTVDYMKYDFNYAADNTYALTAETAAVYAEELAACTDADSFKAYVKAFVTEHNTDETTTEESIDSAVAAMLTSGAAYSDTDSAVTWAFGAKTNDTTVINDTENSLATVVFLVSEPSRDESETRSVRHILISEAQQSDPAAFANTLMGEITAAGGTDDVFAKYAVKYSEDEGSCFQGGLYENIGRGEFVSSIEDWMFDSSRKTGDIAVVESDYGSHIVYYVGEGLQKWAAEVADDITGEYYSGIYEGFKATYPVTVNESTIDKIPEAKFVYSSDETTVAAA